MPLSPLLHAFLSDCLLDASKALCPVLAEGEGAGGLLDGMLVPLAIIFLIFYFLVIRPSGKEKRQREEKLKSLKKHDKVVTNAGIHGKVMSLDDDTMVLQVDDKNNVRMKFSRAAVWQVLSKDGDATSA